LKLEWEWEGEAKEEEEEEDEVRRRGCRGCFFENVLPLQECFRQNKWRKEN
jgi:hypothetical protein